MIKFPTGKVFWALISATVISFASLFYRSKINPDITVSILTVVQIIITFVTGYWYYARMEYTDRRGVPKPGPLSNLASSVIAVTGLLAFYAYGTPWWFWLLSLVLVLGAEKDGEIIFAQQRILNTQQEDDLIQRWRKYIRVHHWYSILRDLSMSMWWLLCGVSIYTFHNTDADAIFLWFAIPYVILVLGWTVLKCSTFEQEVLQFGLSKE